MSEQTALATSRYQSRDLVLESKMTPIRITVGGPRFSLGYTLAGNIAELAPTRPMFQLTKENFELAYRLKLDDVGVPAIAAKFRSLDRQHGSKGLVLLCFDDVVSGEDWCHRTMFSQWWEKETGQEIPELGLTVVATTANMS